MKTIRNWADLNEFGITCLTGEACALGARALCDLTPAGVANVREFFGMLPAGDGAPAFGIFPGAWNSGAIASMFLPWDILPSLAGFLLVKAGCVSAFHVADGIYGQEPDDDQTLFDDWIKGQTVIRTFRGIKAPSRGLACVHQMSGRSQG